MIEATQPFLNESTGNVNIPIDMKGSRVKLLDTGKRENRATSCQTILHTIDIACSASAPYALRFALNFFSNEGNSTEKITTINSRNLPAYEAYCDANRNSMQIPFFSPTICPDIIHSSSLTASSTLLLNSSSLMPHVSHCSCVNQSFIN